MGTTGEHDVIDVEQFGREGRPIPETAKRYRIRIDKQTFIVDVPELTGRELLQLAGKTPVEQFAIYEKLQGGATRKLELDQKANFRKPGVERFMTLPLDQTEGLVSPRRHFTLPEEDARFLDSTGYFWEVVTEAGTHRVVLCGVPTATGYNHDKVDLYFRIEGAYPDTQLDMVYVHPPLARTDGKIINGLARETFDGKTWQRWSRHRTNTNPWRPGIDNLETHLALVREWFMQEFSKR
jgi:hypothetical protein